MYGDIMQYIGLDLHGSVDCKDCGLGMVGSHI